MVQRLTVFISSTVKDFGPVRRDLREWLTRSGILVRSSEDGDFPVEDGVTSHDACVLAVEGAHVVVVLVGGRYGGRYAGTPKSITWREYDEALRLRIPVVPLVLRAVNEDAERWARGQLTAPPFGAQTESIVEFIDHIRKGHADNWMHSLWDGSFHEARAIVQHRLNSLFVSYQLGPYREIRRRAENSQRYAEALLQLDRLAVEIACAPTDVDLPSRLDMLLGGVEEHRAALFGFLPDDRWNLALYRWDATSECLAVVLRYVDPRIHVSNRTWKSGEGHVGSTWQHDELLVAADLTVTESWVATHPTDGQNYRSAVAVPVRRDGVPWGVLVVTSDRVDHFRDRDQMEVLTTISIGLRLEGLVRTGAAP